MEKVIITDISKLRPELLDKSLAELDRLQTELEMARAVIQEREDKKQREKYERDLAAARLSYEDQAAHKLESVTEDISWLLKHGMVQDKTIEVMRSTSGAVVPLNLFKRKLPADFVPPEFSQSAPAPAVRTRRGDGVKRKSSGLAPVSASGEKFLDAVVRVLSENKGKSMSKGQIAERLSTDTNFKAALNASPRTLSGTLSSLVRSDVVKKVGADYVSA